MEEPVIDTTIVENIVVSQPLDDVPVISEPVDMMMVEENIVKVEQHVVSVATSALSVTVEIDPFILELDAAIKSGPSSRVVDKGKSIVEDTEAGMLTEKEYYRLVRKDMQNKISDVEKERLDLFRRKVASIGPSFDWGPRLALWNNRLNDLSSISFDSSSCNDNNDDRRPPNVAAVVRQSQLGRTYKRRRVAGSSSSSHQVLSTETSSVEVSLIVVVTSVSSGLSILGRSVPLPVVTAPFPVVSTKESISVTTSVAASTPISSSAIPTASLFDLLPTSPSSSNLFTTSKSTSLPPLPSAFHGMPPGATQVFVRPSSPTVHLFQNQE
ncbi:hypothetical protein HanRHA438_Chr07g0294941 [Helianthus annuus]|uniref:Uncharacterized protein n=1 Tax=Helianthus annuus TaxID=4232 RepID=A0A9K3IJL2_HELAN|nr:hypothetical protein HanXRQr2_Chr07g0284461 [Helianthus annuus]KAJ0549444.1 hypothetical protein HanHA300_Chr07g0233751 [Helianthus annuus]KAJ0555814.1 hypothetical protein HanIR_Chr07g0306461 [Helianthus annuus]KAJ0562400.1 hypothetical protein HanHA89_Chr07g0250931 [Helianthus annuus]KAJ0727775.1 hypothetical protein HanLR1_Chr07g0233691 [Helianthus annuus]